MSCFDAGHSPNDLVLLEELIVYTAGFTFSYIYTLKYENIC